MQHSIKDLWLYPFPEIDVVHTQEPLLPEPELTTLRSMYLLPAKRQAPFQTG